MAVSKREDSTIGSLQRDLGKIMLIECISTRMLRHPTLLLYSVSHKFHSEGQRPFSIIKRHIPIKSEESPPKAMAEGAAAAEGESVCQCNVRIGL